MRQRNLARRTRSARDVVTGSVDSQYLVGSAAARGHSMRSHSSGRGVVRRSARAAARTRSGAGRGGRGGGGGAGVRWGGVTIRQTVGGKVVASSWRLCGVGVAVRRTHVGGRPRPRQRFGGRGASPGGQAVVSFFTPTT